MKKLVDDWIMLAEKDVKTASIIINEEYLTKDIEEKIKIELNKEIAE
jgi:hypothetical protein